MALYAQTASSLYKNMDASLEYVDAVDKSATETAPLAPVGTAAGAPTKEKAKGKRTTLSVHEKFVVKTFCEQQINDCKARADFVPSHDTLRQEIAAKFGWEVGRSTLSKIMCTEWRQLQIHGHPNPNMKRKRKPLFPAFEEDLVKSVRAYLARHDTTSLDGDGIVMGVKGPPALTEAVILEEAQRLKQQHGIKDEELVLSVGWLARFKNRNGIRLRKTSGSRDQGTFVDTPGELSSDRLFATGESAELAAKRLSGSGLGARPDLIGRWSSGFHFSPSFFGSTGALSISSSLGDLRNHVVMKCGECEPHDGIDTAPSSLLEAVPVDLQGFACAHCGLSLPQGITGLDVVVVGFNSVRDAFVAASLVGEHGSVTCIESNSEAAVMAELHTEVYTTKVLGYAASNLHVIRASTFEFNSPAHGHLLNSRDLVMINCSFHSLMQKAHIIEAAFGMLKEGGECRLSYISSNRRLSLAPTTTNPSTIPAQDITSTAVYVEDFRRMCQHVGFLDQRSLCIRKVELADEATTAPDSASAPDLVAATCRLFKLRLVEDRPEDYGERATYTGVTDSSLLFRLDAQFAFVRNVSMPVDGNTSQILRTSWLKRFFSVEGDRSTHRGRFTYSI